MFVDFSGGGLTGFDRRLSYPKCAPWGIKGVNTFLLATSNYRVDAGDLTRPRPKGLANFHTFLLYLLSHLGRSTPLVSLLIRVSVFFFPFRCRTDVSVFTEVCEEAFVQLLDVCLTPCRRLSQES